MACEQDADSDGIHLARAANIVRRDMLKMTTAFSGSFDTLCQEESVPSAIIALVSMILNGPTIHEQSSHSTTAAPTLTISQLLRFNSCARRRLSTGSVQYTKHSHNRETPVSVYLGVMIHTKTRRRDLVDELYCLGLSVAYDRVLIISSELGDNTCRYFQLEVAVRPHKLNCGLFTTGAVDKIDHNPSSTSARTRSMVQESICSNTRTVTSLEFNGLWTHTTLQQLLQQLSTCQIHTPACLL